MPIADFLPLMPRCITHAPVSSRDAYGKPTYGASKTYRARVTRETKRVRSRVNGQDAISDTTVWVGGVIPNLGIDDRITLHDGSTPTLISWEAPEDETGGHHMKLYMGAA
jgi:hypothetical protein